MQLTKSKLMKISNISWHWCAETMRIIYINNNSKPDLQYLRIRRYRKKVRCNFSWKLIVELVFLLFFVILTLWLFGRAGGGFGHGVWIWSKNAPLDGARIGPGIFEFLRSRISFISARFEGGRSSLNPVETFSFSRDSCSKTGLSGVAWKRPTEDEY